MGAGLGERLDAGEPDRLRPARDDRHPAVELEPFQIHAFLSRGSGAYSPYGVQMFLTCVARRRNSRPSARVQSIAVEAVQVALRLPAESASTLAAPAASPTYQSASTPSCSASVVASALASPVTMLTTPAGHVRRVEDGIEVRRAQRMRRGGNRNDRIAHRNGRHDERDEAEQRRLIGADNAHDAPRLVHRDGDEAAAVAWTAPSYLSAKPA